MVKGEERGAVKRGTTLLQDQIMKSVTMQQPHKLNTSAGADRHSAEKGNFFKLEYTPVSCKVSISKLCKACRLGRGLL